MPKLLIIIIIIIVVTIIFVKVVRLFFKQRLVARHDPHRALPNNSTAGDVDLQSRTRPIPACQSRQATSHVLGLFILRFAALVVVDSTVFVDAGRGAAGADLLVIIFDLALLRTGSSGAAVANLVLAGEGDLEGAGPALAVVFI